MTDMFHIPRARTVMDKLWHVPWILLAVVALLSAVGATIERRSAG